MTVVPDHIKKNVRAVLLSKVGGILVSEFCKDYKSLLKEPLNYRQLKFDSLNDFIKAMPDVVRLEFSDKDMAYKMFGIVDPSDSYTPLVAKMAAGSSPEGKMDRRNMASRCVNGDYSEFLPNGRGHYTLCYPRSKECDGITKEVLEEKFVEFGSLFEVHLIPRMIFVRFTSKDSAIACLDKYSSELNIRIAEEKNPAKGPSQRSRNERSDRGDNDTIIQQKKPREKSGSKNKEGVYEVYIGNLASDVTEDDIGDLCNEFGPSSVRCCKKKDDPRKIFAFVDFLSPESAQSCVDKLNKLDHKGRSLNVRLADECAGSKQNTRSEAPAAPSGGKISWRSGGGQTSNKSSSGIAVLDDNEESWDMGDKNNNNTDKTEKQSSSFGQGSSSFGQSSSSFSKNSSSFGQSSSSFGQQSSSSFGQNSSSFGQSSSSSFGQKSSDSALFGQKSSFGQNSSSSLGQKSYDSSSFGQKSSFGQDSSSSFGQSSSSDGLKTSSFGKLTSRKQAGFSADKASKKNSKEDSENSITIYFGNLHSSITEEVFTDLVKDFSATDIRIRKDKNDERKIFGFINVSSEAIGEEVVNKFHEMEYNGRKMKVRISSKNGQPWTKSNEGETASLRLGGKQNGGNSNNNEESMESKQKNSFGSFDANKSENNSDINQRFGSLSIQVDNSQNRTSVSPVKKVRDGLLKTPPKVNMLQTTYRSPQKMSPKVNHVHQQDFNYNSKQLKSPIVQQDYGQMPSLEPAVDDEMPPLEPAISEEMPPLEPSAYEGMPPLEHADGLSRLWVANFPYFETEDDMMYLFGPHGAVDVYMVNQTNRTKT